jgi:hypothetical protein
MSENATEIKKQRCMKCAKETDNIEPIEIKKTSNNRFSLIATCAVCNKKKSQFIGKDKLKHLPKEMRKKVEKLEKGDSYEGGILPFLPLILAGIAAASTVAGTVANTVIGKNKADEEKRHNEEKEKIMKQAASGESTGSGSRHKDYTAKALKYLKKSGHGFHLY